MNILKLNLSIKSQKSCLGFTRFNYIQKIEQLITQCNSFYLNLVCFVIAKNMSEHDLSLWYIMNAFIQFLCSKVCYQSENAKINWLLYSLYVSWCLKCFLFPMGPHNFTWSQRVIDILNRFGHCIKYSRCEIETSQAEKTPTFLAENTL